MPKLSDTMEEGTILKWLKQVGDPVSQGEILAEVETDKADMELEASTAGVLREIKIKEGESAAVGAVIALVDEQAAAAGATSRRDDGARDDGRAAAPAADKPAAAGGDGGRAKDGGEPTRDEHGEGRAPSSAAAAATKATPGARKLAGERGVDLRALRGSGPGGRIVTDDVETAAKRTPAPPARAAAAAREASHPAAGPAPTADDESAHEEGGRAPTVERRELSRMRQSIARRMSEAFRDIPHFYVTAEIDMTEAVRLKDEHARRGRFGRDDLSGGTFTVSNMGMLDLEEFAAVINPPQAAILAVGAIKARAVVRDGEVVPRRTMRVTVSCDHRIIDGVVAGHFLEELKQLLENPIVLVVRE